MREGLNAMAIAPRLRMNHIVALLAFVAGISTALIYAPPSRSAGSRLVPVFHVKVRSKPYDVGGRRMLEILEVRVTGIHGSLRIGCNRCKRLPGQQRFVRLSRTSMRLVQPGWLIDRSHSVQVSVTKHGRVGRFTRFGTRRGHPNRLVFLETGCMTVQLRRRGCPGPTPTHGDPTVPTLTVITPTTITPTTTTPTTTAPTTTTPTQPPPDLTAPAAPAGLGVTGNSQNSIAVSWQPAADPSGIDHYTVYRNGSALANITGTSYNFGGLACSASYTLGVTATDKANNTSSQAQIGAGTQRCTWAETVGSQTGGADTWTNYTNAGGTKGPHIGAGQTVLISCKLSGFAVADGNPWWYRIASSPWNDAFYVSADAFYNNGQTTGSLSGTPLYDPAVVNC
jgi:hypothetical protein